LVVNSLESPQPFKALVAAGLLSASALAAAAHTAAGRGQPVSSILQEEHAIARSALLQALADFYHCPAIEYDERLPVPPEALDRLDADRLAAIGWFPVMKYAGGPAVIATCDPQNADLAAEVKGYLGTTSCEYHVALPEDIQWFIEDFLHARAGELIGTERTGLAFWRNTMAHWRTLLTCYRTDMATARTALSFARLGFTLATIALAMLRSHRLAVSSPLFVVLFAIGALFCVAWLPVYLKVRRSRLRPPATQTLVEVTAATLTFLEEYHFQADLPIRSQYTKETMLARLGDFLPNHCIILFPPPGSRERIHLAWERNILAAQRTIAACYRTIYARARTGLAFIRTGVAFMGFGIGLITYFGLGLSSLFDGLLIGAGLLMIIDGILWYLPFRREQAELPRTRSGVLAG
jgi:uncharacterized membrane protein YidH (DUF202 family)